MKEDPFKRTTQVNADSFVAESGTHELARLSTPIVVGFTEGLRGDHEDEREAGGGVDEHDPDPVSVEYLLQPRASATGVVTLELRLPPSPERSRECDCQHEAGEIPPDGPCRGARRVVPDQENRESEEQSVGNEDPERDLVPVNLVNLVERHVVEKLPGAEDVDLVRPYRSNVVERQAEIDERQGFCAHVGHLTTAARDEQLRQALRGKGGAPSPFRGIHVLVTVVLS